MCVYCMSGDDNIVYITLATAAFSDISAVTSWLECSDPGDRMVVYSDGSAPLLDIADDRLDVVDLRDDPWLNTWLVTNGYEVPACYDGTKTSKACRAAWATKAASIRHAYANQPPLSVVVWISPGLTVTKQFSREGILNEMSDSDIGYLSGTRLKKHHIIDTSVLIVRVNDATAGVIDRLRCEFDAMATKRTKWRSEGHVLCVVLRDMTAVEDDYSCLVHSLETGAVCRDLCGCHVSTDALSGSRLSAMFSSGSGGITVRKKTEKKMKRGRRQIPQAAGR